MTIMWARRLLGLRNSVSYPVNPVLRRPMSHSPGGVPGQNLPCRKLIGRPGRAAMVFILFFGSGFWVPNVALVYLMHK